MKEIIKHYQSVREDLRLGESWGALELARTQELIQRYLAAAPGVIVDAGGGPGAYAGWLAGLGYAVHLIDPVARHVEQAARLQLSSAQVGDARSLPFADATADAVLLLGPLYHLTERTHRLAALAEARRVLRPAGRLFAAAISRFASLLDSLVRGFVDDPQFRKILDRDLAEGQHRNPTSRPEYFTTAYFHRPHELSEEAIEAGFLDVEVFAVEGPGWLARDFDDRWADSARRGCLLELMRQVEREPALMGISPHLLVVARN